jgi:hypothetical protein
MANVSHDSGRRETARHRTDDSSGMGSYARLGITVAINAVIMFLLTYALIDSFDHFYPNINRAYMAVIMVAPMVMLMLIVMWPMYKSPALNVALIATAAVVFVGVFAIARSQTLIGNESFLRSMIPHHSSAIVMCERAAITDPAITELCDAIVQTQKEEIAEMQAMLERY